MQAETNVPEDLKEATEAALAWVNQTSSMEYELTGLVGTQDIQSTSETSITRPA